MPRPPRPEPPATARTLVGLLSDGDRLRCLAAVVLGASTASEVGERAGLDARATARALERLAGAGLVVRGEGGLAAAPERFGEAARAAAAAEVPAGPPEILGATAEQAAVLRNFVGDDGRLAALPASRTKRLVVLDVLAGRFAPGEVYPEAAVNRLLGEVHDDHAALRRYLVDEGFLERRDGFYWRAGGTFDV